MTKLKELREDLESTLREVGYDQRSAEDMRQYWLGYEHGLKKALEAIERLELVHDAYAKEVLKNDEA